MKTERAFVYIIRCEDDSLYTGITKDVDKRFETHFLKKKAAAKYTKSHQVKYIEAVYRASSYKSAARLEYAIKQLSREKKLSFIRDSYEKGKKTTLGKKLVAEYFPSLKDEHFVLLPEYIKTARTFHGKE